MNREPTRVQAEGTLRYRGTKDGGFIVEWMTARVFVLDYRTPVGTSNVSLCTVVAMETMYLPGHSMPSPAGSIHEMPAWIDYEGDLLTLDIEALVPA